MTKFLNLLKDDSGAAAAEFAGGGQTDAACTAGDDCTASLEIVHRFRAYYPAAGAV